MFERGVIIPYLKKVNSRTSKYKFNSFKWDFYVLKTISYIYFYSFLLAAAIILNGKMQPKEFNNNNNNNELVSVWNKPSCHNWGNHSVFFDLSCRILHFFPLANTIAKDFGSIGSPYNPTLKVLAKLVSMSKGLQVKIGKLIWVFFWPMVEMHHNIVFVLNYSPADSRFVSSALRKRSLNFSQIEKSQWAVQYDCLNTSQGHRLHLRTE